MYYRSSTSRPNSKNRNMRLLSSPNKVKNLAMEDSNMAGESCSISHVAALKITDFSASTAYESERRL